jgi:hypothetical protein
MRYFLVSRSELLFRAKIESEQTVNNSSGSPLLFAASLAIVANGPVIGQPRRAVKKGSASWCTAAFVSRAAAKRLRFA